VWRSRHQVCLKCWNLSARLHDTAFQNALIFKFFFCSVSATLSSWDLNPECTKNIGVMLHTIPLEVPTAVWLTIQVLWMWCSVTRRVFPDISKDYSACIFRVKQFKLLLYPEDDGTITLWYVMTNYSPSDTLSHPRWLQPSTTMMFSWYF
jgi:hypothetical protein